MKTFKIVIYLFSIFAITSCTKVIELKLGNNTGELVIEGNVTNATGPQIIKLSTNVPFSNTNTYPPVTGASVSVSDQNGNTYPFTEGPSGTYSNSQLTGSSGNKYTMTVTSGGKTYTATSVMPAVVNLDSLSSMNDVIQTSDNKKVVTVYYQDPADVTNQYRFVLYVNSVQVDDIYAYNDQFNNGRYVGIDLRENTGGSSVDKGIFSGDTVTVEMQCIDQPIYTYWETLMQEQANGPGGSVTPSNPPTNISPVTLGYFSAHTTQSKTIMVK
ncbi:DUF4249 domain-containing protein [Mucilaginibacter sp. E4BP6]|uniref:DUF4249 domain-containing protein n=1 Tax=Mucilaginibacter sp. E4BP6 TaxID=2723089 RepID=UPI0015CCDFA6|nr:DUF4249 domain-containing protein [Mucilaginibacter sp. E4BP6]NYE65509.1 hypothetical protein [Mucilaginibacter sp. E4BP6]